MKYVNRASLHEDNEINTKIEGLDFTNFGKIQKFDPILVKKIVDQALKDKGCEELILDKLNELKRKRKIINFIDNQIGANNPLKRKFENFDFEKIDFTKFQNMSEDL